MFELNVEAEFSSAHQLREYKGKCENLHGHNWKVCLVVAGEHLDSTGMLVDFVDLKKNLNAVLDELDHQFLNELEPFVKINPTSENIAKYISEAVTLPDGVYVSAVTVWESDKCSATYHPQQM